MMKSTSFAMGAILLLAGLSFAAFMNTTPNNMGIPLKPSRIFTLSLVLLAVLAYREMSRGGSNVNGAFNNYKAGQGPESTKTEGGHIRYVHERIPTDVSQARIADFHALMSSRRTIRFFSPDPVPKNIIMDCLATAGTAPSGAHCQPWHFAVVAADDVKAKIRDAVEREEKLNYERRMGREWVDEVHGMVSDLPEAYVKPYLTDAPYVIVVFKRKQCEEGPSRYPEESVGLACGLLLAALQVANLVTVTSTPMGAEKTIRDLLGRPASDKVFLLMPVGYPSSNATVPYRTKEELRLPLPSIVSLFE
eukprot:m.98734 g.98734  ORF g.98734 m.98734 type:complete len:306 (-) comp13645_c1_seq4:1192-2109(-)